jgi:hypothetical protein
MKNTHTPAPWVDKNLSQWDSPKNNMVMNKIIQILD